MTIEIRIECLDSGQEFQYTFETAHPPLPPVPSALNVSFDQTDARGPHCAVSYDPNGPEDAFVLNFELSYSLVSQRFTMRPVATLFDTKFKRLHFFVTTSRSVTTIYREADIWDA